MTSPDRADAWAEGEAYEPYIGRWSRLVARDFIDWLALPSGGRWLDIGCGTGALTQTIVQRTQPAAVATRPIGSSVSRGVQHLIHE